MSDDAKHEIVIIHRGGHGDHDDHHGGAWKIAFADFMCAMMAFFLVMWLVSANDKTRASVARYFNPVRLVDATTQPRGLHDPKKDESGITASSKGDNAKDDEKGKKATEAAAEKADKAEKPEKAKKAEAPAEKEKRLDKALLESPYVALAEIAAPHGAGEVPKLEEAKAKEPAIGRRGGDAFRDPFAPQPAPVPGKDDSADPDPATPAKPETAKADGAKAEIAKAGSKTEPIKPADAKATDTKPARAEAERAQIMSSLAGSGRDGAGPGVDVKRTDEGLVVSLTDTADFAMFSSGSAVPARRVVLLMEKVAKILKERPGTIVVRGFTDNKPFKGGGRYDNWHLSLDRAQVTHYMLVRGGFDESRIGHIEGFADRGGKAGVDPSSPLNRRIEIVLKDRAT